MNKHDVILEKERDFTDVINATFSFISQEFKPFFKVILLYAGIPIITAALLAAIFSGNTISNMFMAIQGKVQPVDPNYGMMGAMYLVMIITLIFISGLTAAYLDEYRKKGKDNFISSDVWKNFLSILPLTIGVNIVTFLIIMAGFMFCILPGIYLSVPLSFAITILYIEKPDFGTTLKRSFELVSNNWWNTFGLIIVVYLIVSILGGLFSIPSMIIAGIQGFVIATGGESESVNSLPIIISTVIGGLGQYLFYPILYIALGFQYFSLKEKKDQTSLLKKVSEITND